MLLLKRHPSDPGGNQWGPPGGLVNKKEDSRSAVLRELFEETGLKINEVIKLGAHKIVMPHAAIRMTSYKTVVSKKEEVIINPQEHTDYTWLSMDDLLNRDDLLWGVPSVLRDFGFLNESIKDSTLTHGVRIDLLS